MFYFFSIIPFLFIIHQILIHISNAISSGDDKILISFMKGHKEMQISDYSKQKYEEQLGIMHFMRMDWKCDKIWDGFEEYERTECQKYRKYFDILYEYLCREYFGIPTVKPKFVFKKEKIEIEGTIIYAMICLRRISQFYWQTYWSNTRNKLNNFFLYNFEPKLLNENRLNYEPKLPINEMILQLAIDTANEWQTIESLDGIILKNCGQKFEEYLEEMFNKVEERTQQYEDEIQDEYYYIEVTAVNRDVSVFDDSSTWIEDALFSKFVKGQAATNFEQFSKQFINQNSKFEEHLKKYETHLCAVYFIRENWHQCEANCKDNANFQMYRNHLHILYEYLCRLYAEAKSRNESIQLAPLVKPIFIGSMGVVLGLIKVVSNLDVVAKYSCNDKYELITELRPMELANEVELNFDENNKDDLNESTDLSEIRIEFEQKMKKLCEGKSKELEKTHWFTM